MRIDRLSLIIAPMPISHVNIAFCRHGLSIFADRLAKYHLYGNSSHEVPRDETLEMDIMEQIEIAIHSPYELPLEDRQVRWFTPELEQARYSAEYRRTSIIFLDGRDGISCFNYDPQYRSR